MFAVLTAVIACVMGAGGLAGVWSIMFSLRDGDARMDSIEQNLSILRQQVTNSSTTALKAEVDALVAAVDRHRASVRKELGSLWGRLGGRSEERVIDTRQAPSGDFEAMLDLQSRPPAGP